MSDQYESEDDFLARVNAWVNERCPSTGDPELWGRFHDEQFRAITGDLAELQRQDRAPDDGALCAAFLVDPDRQAVAPPPAHPAPPPIYPAPLLVDLTVDILRAAAWLMATLTGAGAVVSGAALGGLPGGLAAFVSSWIILKLTGIYE